MTEERQIPKVLPGLGIGHWVNNISNAVPRVKREMGRNAQRRSTSGEIPAEAGLVLVLVLAPCTWLNAKARPGHQIGHSVSEQRPGTDQDRLGNKSMGRRRQPSERMLTSRPRQA